MYLLPWNWEWWFNPLYGTNDQMEKVYDHLMFHGATYADLIKLGRPLISIDATDVNFGTVFPFVQDQFDLICSDLSTFPVARAVAASNGFPVLFTPITLENHAEQCGGRKPAWVARLMKANEYTRERYIAEMAELYLDPERTKYVHLMDGGIADNLGLRHMINNVLIYADDPDFVRHIGFDKLRRIVLIMADGEAASDSSWPQQRTVSSLGQIFSAVSGSQIDRYNFETVLLAEQQLERLSETLKRIRCDEGTTIAGHACNDVKAYFVRLSLREITDKKVRAELQQIPTGLTISEEAVDKLVEAGSSLVLGSEVLQQFRDELEPTSTAATETQ